MINLVILHINYLLSEKVFLFTVFLIGLASLFLLYSAGVSEAESTLMFYQSFYQKEFVIEMLNFGKILVMVYLLFMMIIGYVVHQYDVIILNRVGIVKLKLSKIVAMMIFVSYLMTLYFMVFVIVSVYITPYMKVGKEMVELYLDFLFFGVFYTVMFAYLYEISKHLLGLIGGFLFYILLFIGSTDDAKKEEVSKLMKWMYRFFIDLCYYEKEGATFFYDKGYYVILILVVGLVVFFLRKHADLIN